MTTFVRSTTLDDAFRSLHLAVGLPDTRNAKNQMQFFLRIALILGWLSVEEAVKDEMRNWRRRGFSGADPRMLSDKICLSAGIKRYVSELYKETHRDVDIQRNSFITMEELDDLIRRSLSLNDQINEQFETQKRVFNMSEFKAQRGIRSDVVHDNTGKTLTLREVGECLEYCKQLIQLASGVPVLIQGF